MNQSRVLFLAAFLLIHIIIVPTSLAERLDEKNSVVLDMEIIQGRLYNSFLTTIRIDAVKGFMVTQLSDGSWPDIDYADQGRSNNKVVDHLSRILSLTQALKTQSGSHDDKFLRAAIYKGLDYWFDNDYQNLNWWWNVIGFPNIMGQILLLLDDEISESRREQGLEILKRAKLGMSGANLADVANISIVRGVIENNSSVVTEAVKKLTDEIHITTGIGIQPDYSFHQHGALLYNHGYGAVFMSNCSYLASVVAGTVFEFNPEKIMLLNNLILDGTRLMMRFDTKDYSAMGRGITRPAENDDRTDYMSSVVDNMLKIPTGRESEYLLFKEQLDVKDDERNLQISNDVVSNNHFWRSDIMTHSMQHFYTSVRMHSSRLFSNDLLINEEGFYTHYLSDGCMYIMRTGREYHEIFPIWDWLKVPGTTVEIKELPPNDIQRKGTTSFVGGVSDGFFGLAAFDFERDGLSAKKSWFFFGDEISSLGAGINSSSGNTIITTINQSFLEGNVKVFNGNEGVIIDNGSHEYSGAVKVSHDSIVYHFDGPGVFRLSNKKQAGNWWRINHSYPKDEITKDVFSLWIDHGKNPLDASYAYVISIPSTMMTSESLKTLEPHSMRIVANTKTLQAVYNEKKNVAGVVFFKPGSVKLSENLKIGVDRACLVLVNLKLPNNMTVSVSNPENKAMSVNVEIGIKKLNDTASFPEKSFGKIINFDLPRGIYAGKSLSKNIIYD